jgi:serine protease Do
LPIKAAELTPRQIYENAAPGVVAVVATEEQGKGSTGSGAIIDQEGLVFTNAHVVINKTTDRPFSQLLVIMKPDRVVGRPEQDYARRFKARLVAINRDLDLAALRFEPGKQKPQALSIGDPGRLHIGDWVAAIGHPEQGGLWTFTTGVVSAEFEDFQNTKGKHVFQTEIGMNRGNSGGPLLDDYGHVVGVNTSIARLAPDGLPITSISFSVKASVLKDWLGEQGITVAYAEPPRAAPAEPAPASTVPVAPAGSVASAPPVLESPKTPTQRPTPPASPPPSVPPVAVAPAQAPTAPSQPPSVAAPPMVREKPAPAPVKTPPAQRAKDSSFKTEVRPYSPDRMVSDIRRLEGEMEDLMEEMRKKIRPR